MCNVCVAENVLYDTKNRGASEIRWSERPGVVVYVQAKGRHAEFKPARYRIRRKGGRWSRWAKTNDLAGVMATYCFDVKWQFLSLSQRVALREATDAAVPRASTEG
jgi:hypothetical protein